MSDDQLIGPGAEPPERVRHDSHDGHDGHDGPARLLALMSARTKVGRSDWGQAMLAELDQVDGSRARWQFALGASRALAIPLVAGQLGLLALAALVTGGFLAVVVDPGSLRVEVSLAPGALCLCAWAAASEPATSTAARRGGRVGRIIAIAAMGACVVVGIRMLTLYPGRPDSGGALWTGAFVLGTLALELATFALLVVRGCEPLGAWRGAGLLGLAAALAIGGVFQLSQPPGGLSSSLPYPMVTRALAATTFGAPVAAGLLAALLARPGQGHGRRRRLRAAAGEVLWGWLLSGPAVFVASLLATTRSAISTEATQPWISPEARHHGASSVLAWVSADDLDGAIVMFSLLFSAGLLGFLVVHAVAKAAQPDPDAAVRPWAPEPPAS